MILATHAIAGAALGKWSGNPWLGFGLGWLSHYVLDMIPHWQYDVKSYKDKDAAGKPKKEGEWAIDFRRALVLTGIDFAAGLAVSILVFQGPEGFLAPSFPILAGAIGGILPDALQAVYLKTKREPFASLQKVHNWFHASWDFDFHSKLGMALQVVLVFALVLLGRAF